MKNLNQHQCKQIAGGIHFEVIDENGIIGIVSSLNYHDTFTCDSFTVFHSSKIYNDITGKTFDLNLNVPLFINGYVVEKTGSGIVISNSL